MDTSKPITLEALKLHMDLTSYLLTAQEKSFWHFIRIEPRKWIHTGYEDEKVEFFVVAVFGKRVIYYDDFEGGFSISEFEEYGKLIGGSSNQNDFHEYISNVFTFITSGNPWW